MRTEYKTGFERLKDFYEDTETRYAVALDAVKQNFTGFTKRAGFGKWPMTEANKKQIRRYYNLLTVYTKERQVYKMPVSDLPKEIKKGGKKSIDKVMQAAQMHDGRKRSKFLFLQYDGENIPQIEMKNNRPVFRSKAGYTKEFIAINPASLIRSVDATINKLKDKAQGAVFFQIANIAHAYGGYCDLPALIRGIKETQQKYIIGTKTSWDKFLTGVIFYYSDTMECYDVSKDMNQKREAFRAKIKAAQKAIKKKRAKK